MRAPGTPTPPVVRPEATAEDVVTWGEFVETRLLAEYRGAGVPIIRMRPAIIRLREMFQTHYPLAHARPFLSTEGRDLVFRAQVDVGLERELCLVVVRNGQRVLSTHAEGFVSAVEFEEDVATAMRPIRAIKQVLVHPPRQFGEPVVRSVPTAVIAELMRAGEGLETIADSYDLSRAEVEAALRYELSARGPVTDRAA